MKISLAEFEIEGIDAIISDTGDLIAEQNRLRESNKRLKKDTDGLTTSTEDQRRKYVENQVEIKRLSQEINNNNKIVQAQTQSQRQLNDALERNVDTEAKARASNSELIAIRRTLNRNTAEGRQQIDQINSKLDENNKVIKENVSEYEKQKIGIGDYTAGIKEAFAQTGGFNSILGTLQSTFKTLGPLTKAIKNDFSSLSSAYKRGAQEARLLSGTQRVLAQTTNLVNLALKAFRLALISTGIGAILVAFGSLVAFLTSTQAGIDKVNSVLIPLRVVFETLAGLFQEVGEALFNAFSSPRQTIEGIVDFIKNQVTARFNAFQKQLQGIAKILTLDFKEGFDLIKEGSQDISEANKVIIDGIKGAADAVSGTVNEAIERGKQIAALQISIEQAEVRIIGIRAETNNQLKIQEQIAKDTTLSTTERLAATEEAKRLSQELQEEENKILQLKIQQLELEQLSNDTSREEQKELEELRAQLVRNETQARQTELRFLGARNSILKEQEAARKKAVADNIKDSELLLKLFIESEDDKLKTLEERLEFEARIADEEIEIQQQKLDAQLINQLEFELAVLQIKEDFLARQAELTIANLEEELKLFQAQNASRLEGQDRLTDSLVQAEIDRLRTVFEANQQILQEQRDAGLISEKEFLTEQALQEDEFNAERDAINKDLEDQKKAERLESEALEFEERILRLEERDATEFELSRIQAERDQEIALQEAEATIKNEENLEQAKRNIKLRFAKSNLAIDQAEAQARIDARLQILGAIGQIFGKESAVGKASAIAQTSIDTYASATAAYKSLVGIPVVGPALAAVASAAAIAGGLANVAQISGINIGGGNVSTGLGNLSTGISNLGSTLPKGEKGLTLQGRRHSQGGEPIFDRFGRPLAELEGGENLYVLNRNASSLINSLSNVNQATGGVPLSTMTTFAQSGGQVARQLTSSQRDLELTQALIEDNISNIRVVNDVLETSSVLDDVIEVENQANI